MIKIKRYSDRVMHQCNASKMCKINRDVKCSRIDRKEKCFEHL